MRWWQSRDSCDSDAFARPRARRALTGLQGLDVRPCPTPPGPSAGSVAGSCAALVAVCCGRKVALFTLQHGGQVLWSNCNFSVLSGPGVLYHVPIACTNAAGRSEEFFPDWGKSSTPDFGLRGWLHRHRGTQHVIDTRIIYFTVYVLVVVGRRSSPGRRVCGVPEKSRRELWQGDRLKVRSGATATEHYCTHKPDTRRLITMVRTIKV